MPKALTDSARKNLKRWATVNAQRDQLVQLAASAGVGVNEISRITGLAKTTVIRIVHPPQLSSTPAEWADILHDPFEPLMQTMAV